MSRRHLVVDLGGVLFRFDHARRLLHLADLFGLPADRIDELLWRSGFNADCDAGGYPNAAEIRDRIRAATGFTGGGDQLDAAWCSAFQPDLAVREALDRHRGARPVALFTNNGPLEEEVLLRLYPAMFDGFEHLLFSHRLGRRKPDRAAFDAASRHLGATRATSCSSTTASPTSTPHAPQAGSPCTFRARKPWSKSLSSDRHRHEEHPERPLQAQTPGQATGGSATPDARHVIGGHGSAVAVPIRWSDTSPAPHPANRRPPITRLER